MSRILPLSKRKGNHFLNLEPPRSITRPRRPWSSRSRNLGQKRSTRTRFSMKTIVREKTKEHCCHSPCKIYVTMSFHALPTIKFQVTNSTAPFILNCKYLILPFAPSLARLLDVCLIWPSDISGGAWLLSGMLTLARQSQIAEDTMWANFETCEILQKVTLSEVMQPALILQNRTRKTGSALLVAAKEACGLHASTFH